MKAVFGYRDHPTVIEASLYFLYLAGMGAWYLRGVLVRRRPADALDCTHSPSAT